MEWNALDVTRLVEAGFTQVPANHRLYFYINQPDLRLCELQLIFNCLGYKTQMLGSLFLQAAVADSLHVACGLLHGQNQRWDNITLTLYNNLGNLLPSTVSSTEILEARLSSKPTSG
jgi:hypothetical protein